MNRKLKIGFRVVAMQQWLSSSRQVGCLIVFWIGVIAWSSTLALAQEAVVNNKFPSTRLKAFPVFNDSSRNLLRSRAARARNSFRAYPKTHPTAYPSYSPRLAPLPTLKRAPHPAPESVSESVFKPALESDFQPLSKAASEPASESVLKSAASAAEPDLEPAPAPEPIASAPAPEPAASAAEPDLEPAPESGIAAYAAEPDLESAPASEPAAESDLEPESDLKSDPLKEFSEAIAQPSSRLDDSPSFESPSAAPISIAKELKKQPSQLAAKSVSVSKKATIEPRPRTTELTRYSNLSKSVARPVPRISSAGDEAFTEPIERIKIAAAENGIIGDVAVKRGDAVETGDLLFELDMSVLEASRKLATAKANSKASLKAAEVELAARTKNYEEKVALMADRTVSSEEVQQAKTEVGLAQQKIEAIIEEQGQANLETKRIETLMEQRRTRSPINGVVIDVNRKPGEYVSSSDPHIATVVQLDKLRVVFHLPTVQVESVRSGDVASLLFPESGLQAEGVVRYVAPITDAVSGRVRVEVLVENESGEYRSGVRCRILQSGTRQSMLDSDSAEPQTAHH